MKTRERIICWIHRGIELKKRVGIIKGSSQNVKMKSLNKVRLTTKNSHK